MKVKDLDLQNVYGLTILEIRNEKKKALGKEITQNMAWADSVINTNDILYFYGDKAGMQRLALDYHLEDMHGTDLDFYDIGIAELVLLPTSSLIGTRIKKLPSEGGSFGERVGNTAW